MKNQKKKAKKAQANSDFLLAVEQMGQREQEEFSACDLCGKIIKHGNACVEVSRQVEQIDWDEALSDSVITVIDSDGLLMLCAGCGNRLSTERLKEHLQLLLRPLRDTL